MQHLYVRQHRRQSATPPSTVAPPHRRTRCGRTCCAAEGAAPADLARPRPCPRFEWSPGRVDEAYTGNRSAFDVFVDYDGPLGRSFLGIEIKYHEDHFGQAAKDENGRYATPADRHGIFREELVPALQKPPLQQIWLDHLLALQLRSNPKNDGWKAGACVLLYPVGNTACADGAARYRRCLTEADTFDARTLDDVVQAARLTSPASWPDDVYARYLDPTLVNATIVDPAGA